MIQADGQAALVRSDMRRVLGTVLGLVPGPFLHGGDSDHETN